MTLRNVIREKLKEAVIAVLPISLIVCIVCFAVVPVKSGLMLSFLIGSAMLIVGMALFTIGAELSMTKIGNHIGAKITQSRKLWMILLLSFVLGVAITMAEPDLQVLATNVPGIDTTVLVLTVSVGVGLFLLVSMMRILFEVELKWIFIVLYAVIFTISAFADKSFLSIAFDSGGVTTGPMTVPFIMALGVGVSSIRSDKNAKTDSFGLVALCSIGPILSVLILSFFYSTEGGNISTGDFVIFENTVELGFGYLCSFPTYIWEVAKALAPIFAFFLIFQLVSLRLKTKMFLSIVFGVVCTYAGLVLFLTGVNVGFSPLGYVLGNELMSSSYHILIIPLSMLIGWFIINAEPAVHVLNKQVEELSAGAVSEKAMRYSLSIAVSLAMGLSMIRVYTGLSIMWFVLPGYAIALILTFFVPPTFTAIAFDSGGVASGPLTATFMLPFAMGASIATGGSVMEDAFGLVALVAMMPLITVQIMGAVYMIKSRSGVETNNESLYADDEIIELWEVA